MKKEYFLEEKVFILVKDFFKKIGGRKMCRWQPAVLFIRQNPGFLETLVFLEIVF